VHEYPVLISKFRRDAKWRIKFAINLPNEHLEFHLLGAISYITCEAAGSRGGRKRREGKEGRERPTNKKPVFPHFNLPATRARILKNSAASERRTSHPIGQVHPVEWSVRRRGRGEWEGGREGAKRAGREKSRNRRRNGFRSRARRVARCRAFRILVAR